MELRYTGNVICDSPCWSDSAGAENTAGEIVSVQNDGPPRLIYHPWITLSGGLRGYYDCRKPVHHLLGQAIFFRSTRKGSYPFTNVRYAVVGKIEPGEHGGRDAIVVQMYDSDQEAVTASHLILRIRSNKGYRK